MPGLGWLSEIFAEIKARRDDHPSCNAGFLEVRNSLGDLFSALEPHTSVGDADPVSEPSQDWVERMQEKIEAQSKHYPSSCGTAFSRLDGALRKLREEIQAHAVEDEAARKQRDFARRLAEDKKALEAANKAKGDAANWVPLKDRK